MTMNFNFLRIGLVALLSGAMAFGAMAQKKNEKANPTNPSNDKDRVIVMSKKELAETVSRIVEETLKEEEVVVQNNRIDNLIQNRKDRDILTLLLQYRNLQNMFANVMAPQCNGCHQATCSHSQPQTNNVAQTPSSQKDLETLAQLRELEQEIIQLRSMVSNRPSGQNADIMNKLNDINSDLQKRPNADNAEILKSLNDLNRDLQARLQALENKSNNEDDMLRRREEALANRNPARSDVQMMRSVYFKINSDQLSVEGASAIKNVAQFVANNPRSLVLVYGYASIDGPVQHNNELSERRAVSVVKALREAGVPEVAIVKYANGVDTMPAEKENARRVDMQVIF